MTQKEKELLLKELCARLPYSTKYEVDGFKPNVKCRNGKLDDNAWDSISLIIDTESEYHELCHIKHINPDGIIYHNYVHFSRLKPYLFPISSMTDEQMHDFFCRFVVNEIDYIDFKHYYVEQNRWNKIFTTISDCVEVVDWFNKNHFDYRGLIEKELAMDATGKNIY